MEAALKHKKVWIDLSSDRRAQEFKTAAANAECKKGTYFLTAWTWARSTLWLTLWASIETLGF